MSLQIFPMLRSTARRWALVSVQLKFLAGSQSLTSLKTQCSSHTVLPLRHYLFPGVHEVDVDSVGQSWQLGPLT